MLKRILCQAQFTWELSCWGPLLIADGRYDNDVLKEILTEEEQKARKGWYPNKFFINRKSRKNLLETIKNFGKTSPEFNENFGFYLPGTSLRGPFRAQAERIIRTLATPDAKVPCTACDPFEQNDANNQYYCCTKRLEIKSGRLAYKRACPACKIFGAAGLASRLRINDGAITQGVSVYRDMIGIDRFTGGVFTPTAGAGGGAKMRVHALENTMCHATITLTNFELWHLGLLAYVFQDFKDGLVPIGFGKTKGFGQVTGKVTAITFEFCKKPNGIEHLGSLMTNPDERERYGVTESASLEFQGYDTPTGTADGLRWYHQRAITNGKKIQDFFQVVKDPFNKFIQTLAPEETE